MICKNCGDSMRELGRALREGSTLPARFIIFLASFTWGIGLLTLPPDNWVENRAFLALRAIAGQYWWGSVFLFLSLLVFWRIVDWRSRLYWSYFINSLAFGFWFVITFLRLWNRFEIWPVMATDIALCLISFWVALRVNITPRDRETA